MIIEYKNVEVKIDGSVLVITPINNIYEVKRVKLTIPNDVLTIVFNSIIISETVDGIAFGNQITNTLKLFNEE